MCDNVALFICTSGSASVSDKGGSARNVDETADTDYGDAGLDVDGDGLDNILMDKAEGNGYALLKTAPS